MPKVRQALISAQEAMLEQEMRDGLNCLHIARECLQFELLCFTNIMFSPRPTTTCGRAGGILRRRAMAARQFRV